ncbi:MAG: phosphodiester glycosidase family protein [Eubacteriales bacterium]|nr:phosphodiester glycosidase family protein [Eubacteriales bacterium]
MSKKNMNPVPGPDNGAAMPPKKKKKKGSGLLGRIIRRFFLVLFTVVILAVAALVLVMNLVFNGPSPAARDTLTMSLIEASATKWVPALFIGEDTVAEIRTSTVEGDGLESDVTDTTKVIIQANNVITGDSNEWDNYPDGVRIERRSGDTYNAHIMIVKDPSQVYMGTSTEKYSTAIPGKRITEVMAENDDVIAAINAGAFNDDGTASSTVGSTPLGLVMSGGNCVWTSGKQPGLEGFAGFNEDNILVVSKTNLTSAQAEELKIRDGCCFGPVLIMNGEVNLEAYNDKSGLNPRTAIGQRADGAVIFVCIDGRQAGSLGGYYSDIIDIMQEYGAVNACNMDGGSSSVMMYRDTYGKLGTAGETVMVNNYSLLQSQPRRMPNFWMVRAAS